MFLRVKKRRIEVSQSQPGCPSQHALGETQRTCSAEIKPIDIVQSSLLRWPRSATSCSLVGVETCPDIQHLGLRIRIAAFPSKPLPQVQRILAPLGRYGSRKGDCPYRRRRYAAVAIHTSFYGL